MTEAQTVRDRLVNALKREYDDIEIDFGPVRPGRVSGVLVTTHFERKTTNARQDEIWDLINRTLGADAVDVSTIVTLTPAEYEAMRA
jgi:acid stress-induced BolA-like protein IbaG/YrbA